MPRKSRSRALSIMEGRVTICHQEVHRVESELRAATARWTEAIAARDAVEAGLTRPKTKPVRAARKAPAFPPVDGAVPIAHPIAVDQVV